MNFSQEIKKNQSGNNQTHLQTTNLIFNLIFNVEIDKLLLEIDKDVEGMQSTIYYLQQLKDSNTKIESLEHDIQLMEQINLDKESKTRLKED